IREMRSFIRFLAETEGLTVLVSSHLLSEIQLMCDRVAIISKGKIIKVDEVDQLLTRKERLIWRVTPMEEAKKVLSIYTDVTELEDGTLITPYIENEAASWNQFLVEKGIEVREMNRKLPALEDLFLELTGGESSD
ncbi:MAG TPA: ABC transporter ATP-binding protein, partial [Pseudoneobacillus sp.]|nr:ABC transporter ATP-binding protein [Pseudoneobacillus sp.]